MKKFLTMALAMVMAVCVAMPAFAAGSDTKSTDIEVEETEETAPVGEPAKSADGKSIRIAPPTKSIPDASAALAQAGVTVPAGGTATVAYLQDIHADSLPIEMTFNIGGGDPNALLYVLHWNSHTNVWETVAEGKGNWVHARFTSLSPVAVVRVTGVPATAGGRTVRTAPQTGASMMVPYIALVVMAMAGLVAMKARKKEM